jgi:hypothetical protein
MCFVEANKGKVKSINRRDLPKLLAVRFFGIQPWYDHTISVQWVHHLYNEISNEHKRFVGITWPVDEYDYPLQEALKAEGFRATKTVSVPADSIFCNGVRDVELTRIIFTLS